MEYDYKPRDQRRLALRAVEPGDADLLYDVENDEDAWDDGDTESPYSMHVLAEYARNYRAEPFADGQLRLIVIDADTREPVGIADLYNISQRNLNAYVAIYILPEMRCRGLGSRVVRLITEYAQKRLGLLGIAARMRRSNHVSWCMFTNNGYEIAGSLRNWQRTVSGMEDVIVVQWVPQEEKEEKEGNQLSAGSEGTESQLR